MRARRIAVAVLVVYAIAVFGVSPAIAIAMSGAGPWWVWPAFLGGVAPLCWALEVLRPKIRSGPVPPGTYRSHIRRIQADDDQVRIELGLGDPPERPWQRSGDLRRTRHLSEEDP